LTGLGAMLVAITPQLPEQSLGLIEKHRLQFEMLSDPGNAYAAELGIRYEVASDLKEVYQGFGIDLLKSNGDDSWTLPMPTRLVVDQSGIVRATDIGPDPTRRPEPQRTLDDVRALG